MKTIFAFFLLLLTGSVFAQVPTQTIRGTVVDNQTKAGLPGAIVILADSGSFKNTAADVNGKFRFDNIPVGRHAIQVKMTGYKERSLTVILSAGKEVVLTIEVEESVYEGKEVVITAETQKSKPNNEMSTVSSRSFTIEETQKYAGSLGDPSRMAANYAGVSGANDSRNDIVIRGNSPQGLLWRLNGTDIPNPNHFGSFGSTGGPVSILNNNVLDNSDFMTSAFPAEYGNALAGAFDLRLRKGNNERFEFLGQVGFNGFEGGIEGPFSKKHNGSFLINYRYSTLVLFQKIGVDFGTGTAIPKYQDVSFNFNLPTEKAGTFSWWGVGGLSNVNLLDSERDTTKLDLYTIGGYDTYYTTRMGVTGLTHVYPFGARAWGRLNIGVNLSQNQVQLDSFSFQDRSKWANYGSNFRQTKINMNYTFVQKFNSRNTLKAGVFVDRIDYLLLDSTALSTTVFRRIRDVEGYTFLVQAFTQWQHKFTDLLTLNLGVHYQELMLNNSRAIEPRMGLRWQVNEKQFLSFGAGLHSQMLTIFTYFNQTLLPDGSYLQTNRNLDFSKSAHGVVAWDWNLTSQMRLKAEVYYQHLYNIPIERRSSIFSFLNEGADFNAPGIDSLINNGTGRNYGLEFTLEKFYSKGFYFLATASLFESKYTGSDNVERNTAFNGNYVFNLLGGYELKIGQRSRLSFDIKGNLAGGKRYVPIDINASALAQEEVYDPTHAYEKRYADYFRVDFKVGYVMESKKWKMTQTWMLEFMNLTDHKNVFTQVYDKDSNTLKTNYQTGLLLIPKYIITF
jgi:hypothetical protein